MTQDEIIRMMKEAGFYIAETDEFHPEWERFAALVAQNYMAKACGGCVIKQCYKQMDPKIEAAILAEREACAKVCEEGWKEGLGAKYQGDVFATAIRSRSNEH